ncbi:MAG: hypothetical protein ACM33T_00335 [Solirubrobacterales bacterium]
MGKGSFVDAVSPRDLALVAGWRPGWDFALPAVDVAAVREAVSPTAPPLKPALDVLAPSFERLTGGIGLDIGFGPLFGTLWPGHGLAQTRTLLFGETLTEPLATRRMAFFLSPQTNPEPLAMVRAHSFAIALLAEAGIRWRLPEVAPGTLVVKAELGMTAKDGAKRQADLWLEWLSPEGKLRCLVVEAKVDAPDRPGQLRAYRDYLRSRVSGKRNAQGWCVYLTLDGRKPPLRERAGWLSASWFGLLRRWESLLAADPLHRSPIDPELSAHPDFDGFRHSLWQELASLED